MTHFAKTLLREIALHTPVLRNRFLDWDFLRREQSFRGIFPSFQEARLHSPSHRLAGYDHEEIARIDEARREQLNPADYPVLFWLAPLLAQTRRVFDLGGNLGVAFYAYRRYLGFPADLRWLVCEVPATAAAGRELAAAHGETQLAFTDRIEEAEGCDIYFTCGALQYIEEPFDAIVARLSSRPAHLLVNRVPMRRGPGFITLQNNGAWVVPYKIVKEDEFIGGLTALGYELVDRWRTARSLEVLGSPAHRVENYQGMYFRRR